MESSFVTPLPGGDPLSDVLSLLKSRSYMAGGIDVGGDWSFHFPAFDVIRCFAVVTGACWLTVEGVPEPLRLETGDCALLPQGGPFRLASDLSLDPVDVMTVITAPLHGRVITHNGGGNCMAISALFSFARTQASLLLDVLPPVVHLNKDSDKDALRWSLERLRDELQRPRAGGTLVAEHLSHMILLLALRLYLEEGRGVGWLFALSDPCLSLAIRAMHREPGHSWTLQELASQARLSRSTFALKFKETVGESPMEYLTRWRMLLAGERLRNSDESVATVAQAVSYESESAFGATFKRIMGCSPRQYSRL